MTAFKKNTILPFLLTCGAILLSIPGYAQKYKTLADTIRLNSEYTKVSLDLATLNASLAAAEEKAAAYQAESRSTAEGALESAQDSKEQAAKAAGGSKKELERAVKKARKANNKANDAEDALADQEDNDKKIKNYQSQIVKKQKRLGELDKQRNLLIPN